MGLAAAVRHHMTGVTPRLSVATVARIHLTRRLMKLVALVTAAITVIVVSSMTMKCIGIAWRGGTVRPDGGSMGMGIRFCSRSRLPTHAA